METQRTLIAVAVKEDGSLWSGHFGMAPFYNIYSADGKFTEKRENPYGAENKNHQHHDNPKLIVNFLNDCKVFIAKKMGGDSRRKLVENFGIIAFLTEADTPEKAVKQYLSRPQ